MALITVAQPLRWPVILNAFFNYSIPYSCRNISICTLKVGYRLNHLPAILIPLLTISHLVALCLILLSSTLVSFSYCTPLSSTLTVNTSTTK